MEASQIVQGISQSVFGEREKNPTEIPGSDVRLDAFKQALESMSPAEIDTSDDSINVISPGTKSTATEPGLAEQLRNGVGSIDKEFRGTMSRLESWPSFKSYLERFDTSLEKSISLDSENSVRHVSNIDQNNDVLDFTENNASLSAGDNESNPLTDKFEELHNISQTYYQASTQYTTESTMWFLKAEFWMTKVKVLTSAMSQVTQGVRTLFTG